MPKQSGFSALLIVIILFFISVIALGSYLIYKNGFKAATKSETKRDTTEKTEQRPIGGRIVFVSLDDQISTANPDGTDIKPIFRSETAGDQVEKLINISPDGRKILFTKAVKYDQSDPENIDYKKGLGQAYYLANIDGTQIKKIDLGKITFGEQFAFFGWSTDGSKLLFTAKTLLPNNTFRTVAGIYDPETAESQDIYMLGSEEVSLKYYDRQSSTLVFREKRTYQDGITAQKMYKLNVDTLELEEFANSNLSQAGIDIMNNPYFLTSEVRNDSTERKHLILRTYENPNTSIKTFTITDPDANFANYYYWSPDGKYFTVTSQNKNDKEGNITLHVFSREKEKEVTTFKTASFATITDTIFSPENTQLLLAGTSNLRDKSKVGPIWQVIDLNSGLTITTETAKFGITLDTIFWLR